jgi:transcriptional regulator with XRE-family HTH domain
MISAAQIRAARHLLGLDQADIAKSTGLSLPTIKRVESDRDVSVSPAAAQLVKRALEAAGVEFTNGGQPGVRLRAKGDGSTIANNDLNSENDS